MRRRRIRKNPARRRWAASHSWRRWCRCSHCTPIAQRWRSCCLSPLVRSSASPTTTRQSAPARTPGCARTKYLLTALAAVMFLRFGVEGNINADVLFRTGAYVLTVPHWLWLALGILAVSGTMHAVNLTDGLDGLAAGTMVPPLLVLALPAFVHTQSAAPAFAALLGMGACFGFLVFNRHPAKVFMGDTGSLALGALLAGVAILSGEMLLLILIGGVFVAEALSVIIQVTYFKRTGGKRIFKMSPLHHHFEISGWPETIVTARFWLASAAVSLLGLALVR
ncbi:MAG: phospho-N-acetylmuramoyl-pentapeptide-transferase [Candidatus Baltobacteraceae bacterium]